MPFQGKFLNQVVVGPPWRGARVRCHGHKRRCDSGEPSQRPALNGRTIHIFIQRSSFNIYGVLFPFLNYFVNSFFMHNFPKMKEWDFVSRAACGTLGSV